MAYILYRTWYPDVWLAASHHLDVTLGAFQHGGPHPQLADDGARRARGADGNKNGTALFLVLTMVLGVVFLGVKVVEYSDKFTHHLVPGPTFQFDAPYQRTAQIFFSIYFAMTGMHALHMVIGEGIMLYLLVGALKGRFSAAYYTPVEIGGLYWHFVDIIWIFLFRCSNLVDTTERRRF